MRTLLICALVATACSAPPSSRIVPSDAIEQFRAAMGYHHVNRRLTDARKRGRCS